MSTYEKNRYKELIALAKEKGIVIDHNCPKSIVAMAVRCDNGLKVISLPPEDVEPDGYVIGPTVLECFAHEMGNFVTDSFYPLYTPREGRIEPEEKAMAWAIQFLMPLQEILSFISYDKRIKQGLARHFGVGEEFVEEAVDFYRSVHEENVPQVQDVDREPDEAPKDATEIQVGQKVWYIMALFRIGRMRTQQIVSLDHLKSAIRGEAEFYIAEKSATKSDSARIGKFIFLTKEEAEAKLKEYREKIGEGR